MSRAGSCGVMSWVIVFTIALFNVWDPSGAYAQSTASISGVVKDTDGSVMPGVSVVIKNDSSGASQEVTTDAAGRYQATALGAGAYTVSATLSGFKTATAKGVQVAPGQPVTIPLTLEIGQLEETVVVTSSSELINTENGTVAATLNSDQLLRMPTPTRNALNAVAFLPGVNTTGTNRDSTINGLPESFVSITLDGVSNNDNFLRNTDSFFASVTPRQDAVEAVAVTMSAAGAQIGGGAGAVTMAFQTRSGGNRFTGSAYEYYRNPDFNSNYVFNEINHQGKNEVKLHTFGARAGGPIVIPGLYDGHNKAFFFAHYEQIRFPNSFTRTRTTFNSRVYDGWFRYQFGNDVREVNLLQLAAANGQLSATDPTSMNLQLQIDAATKTTGTRSANSDPLYDNYVWQSPSELFEHQPTVRLDYNISDNNRLSGSFSTITAKRTPDYLNNADPRFPGAPNQRDFVSKRPLISTSLRSVLSQNMVNELRGGLTAFASGSNFGYPSSVTSRNDPSTFSDSAGFAITTPGSTTDWFTSNTPSWRKAPTYSIEDTLTWNRGAHTITTGGNLLVQNASSSGQTIVRGITLGFNTDFDPAAGMFTTANFPGASSAQLDAARATYAVLTGRVASVTSQAVLNGDTGQYEELAPEHARRRHQSVRGVRARHVADQTESDVDRRNPLRRHDAVRADEQCHVVGDDGQHLRTIGRRRRRRLQPLQLSRAWIPRRCCPAVQPARAGLAGLQDGFEQHRALGEYRLAAERGLRVPARPPGRSRSGNASRRILRSLRSAGTLAVHRSLWRQPRRVDLADAKRQHRAGAAWRIVAGSTLADRPTHAPALQSRSDLPDRRRRQPRGQHQCLRA